MFVMLYLYMHHDCFAPILHRDISSNNILLDLEFRACISDFGIAKILSADDSNCTRLAGTKGYLAPGKIISISVRSVCCYVFIFILLSMPRSNLYKYPNSLFNQLSYHSFVYQPHFVCLYSLVCTIYIGNSY